MLGCGLSAELGGQGVLGRRLSMELLLLGERLAPPSHIPFVAVGLQGQGWGGSAWKRKRLPTTDFCCCFRASVLGAAAGSGPGMAGWRTGREMRVGRRPQGWSKPTLRSCLAACWCLGKVDTGCSASPASPQASSQPLALLLQPQVL